MRLAYLTSVAMHTERIALGTAVINIYTRHPVLIAQTLNTISELAPGRLRLGIGAGMTWRSLLEAQGFDLHPLRDMKNAVITIRGLLQGDRIPWEGGTLGLEVARKCFYNHYHQPINLFRSISAPWDLE